MGVVIRTRVGGMISDRTLVVRNSREHRNRLAALVVPRSRSRAARLQRLVVNLNTHPQAVKAAVARLAAGSWR